MSIFAIDPDVSNSGASISANSSFGAEVALGNVKNYSIVQKFGKNAGVPNGSFEPLVGLSTAIPWLTADTTVRVKAGGNAADTVAGANARTVVIEGLDATGAPATEQVSLAGASASSSTSTSFIRVFRAYVRHVGTYSASNLGNIVVEDSGGTNDLVQIAAGEGQTQFCAYTIPLGYTGIVLSATAQVDASKPADFRLMTRDSILATAGNMGATRVRHYWDGVSSTNIVKPVTPLLTLAALTDVWMEASGSGAGTEAAGNIEILLVQDS